MATSALAALEQYEIEREVNDKNDDLVACYEAAMKRNPKLKKGKIVTRYMVEKSGKVSSARVIRNELGDRKLGSCVRKVFLTLDYGEQPQQTRVTYPLDFK